MATVLSSCEYYKCLPEYIKSGHGPVLIQAMGICFDKSTKQISQSLTNRAERDPVTIVRDAYSKYVLPGGMPLFFAPFLSKEAVLRTDSLAETANTVASLTKKGGRVITTNEPDNLFAKELVFIWGRDHRKLTVNGEQVFLPCANINGRESTINQPILLLTENDIAYQLRKNSTGVNSTRPRLDIVIPCGSDTEILIDAGLGTSVIMTKAVKLLDSAQRSIKLMTPYFPAGKIKSKLIEAVSRGVEVKLVISDRSINVIELAKSLLLKAKTQFNIHAPEEKITHGKLLVVDDEIAVMGSHNFYPILVASHTTELSIKSRRKSIVDPLCEFFDQTFFNGYKIN